MKTNWFLEWYTPTILLLYTLFPILYKMIEGIKGKHVHVVYALTLVYFLSALWVSPDYQPWVFCIFRIPVFIIGMYVAYDRKGIHTQWAFALFMVGIASYCMKLIDMEGSNAKWLFSVANIALFVIIASIFIIRQIERVSKSLILILSYIGKMSYELFLVQILFLRMHIFDNISIAAGIVCMIILSVLLHHILEYITKKIIIHSTQLNENN